MRSAVVSSRATVIAAAAFRGIHRHALRVTGAIALGLFSASWFAAPAATAQDGAALYASMCSACHNDVAHPKGLVYNAAGNVAIIEAVNAFGMGATGSLADHTSIAAYLDTVKPTINLAPVAYNSPGTFIAVSDIVVSGAQAHASWRIIDQVETVVPPTKGVVTYQYKNGFGEPSYATYTPFAGQSGFDTWTYHGTGTKGTTTIRTASVNIANADGTFPPPPVSTVAAVEYHHAAWDHFFVTAIPAEISSLDRGVFAGWARTGLQFNVYPLDVAATNSTYVCRFFSTSFAPRSSHYYSPEPGCAQLMTNSNWQLEGQVFNLAASPTGTCPTATTPLYRLYNNGAGSAPNHRYTTDAAVRDQMVAAGWTAEGNGPNTVFMCAPL
jgi:hypothetical protein